MKESGLFVIVVQSAPVRLQWCMYYRSQSHAGFPVDIESTHSSDIERRSAIQIACRMIIDIRHQTMHIIHRKMATGIPPIDLDRKRRTVLIHGIDQRQLLQHDIRDLCNIAARSLVLVRPILRRGQPAFAREPVLRVQVQGRDVHDDEVPAPVGVDARQLVVHAVEVALDGRAGDLGVGDEGAVAEVVRADPDRVDGCVGIVVHELGAVLVVVAVIEVGRQLVAGDVGERGVYGSEGAGGDFVGADGTGDGVVVEIYTGVLFYVLRPWASAICCSVVLVEVSAQCEVP